MDQPHQVLSEAAHLLDEGHVKDAYMRFLSAIELSSQQLHGVKFVHHTVVGRPAQYDEAITAIRSSLDCLEKIVAEHSPAPLPPRTTLSHEPLNGVNLPTPIQEQPTGESDTQSLRSDRSSNWTKTPPPLPPKPPRIHKPAIPPKPSKLPAAAAPPPPPPPPHPHPHVHAHAHAHAYPPHPPLQSPSSSTTTSNASNGLSSAVSSTSSAFLPRTPASAFVKRNNRARGNSVSFAEQTSDHEISDDDEPIQDPIQDDEYDDDDDDDDIIDFDGATDEDARSVPDKIINDMPTRPHTMTDAHPQMPIIDTRRRSLTASHHQRPARSPVDVLADSAVDPRNLVPAQTNTGDSLAPPSATQTTDYVPNIPVPPLLSTHRRLQDQLDDLEESLEECKARKRALNVTPGAADQDRKAAALDRELGDTILQRTAAVAETRETLNKVRTLYMSAATVPSLMQFPPHLVAYQLTLIEASIFHDIPPEALLTHSPRTPHAKVVASTDFFNYITRAIEHSILLPQEASRRAELINRWIKVATKCLALSNYQTLKAIVSALGTPPVQRLRRTWDCIPKKRMGRLELLNVLMSETDNYGRYREHMGLENRRRWNKPVVPFLGVFIHDMTYLLAAVKGSAEGDSRVQDILTIIRGFQSAPRYPQRLPSSYVKASKKHSFRPNVITNALHRSSSAKNRMSNSSLFGVDAEDQDKSVELEQQLITQYLLMRPWVHEKIIDELSLLREPPKPRANTSPSYARSNNNVSSVANMSTNSHTSSILSNASSLVRLSSSYSTNTSTTSWEEQQDDTTKRTGFWPFRKSSEMTRPTTLQSDIYVERRRSNSTWSDDDEEEDDQTVMTVTRDGAQPRSSESIPSRAASSTNKLLSGHVRSLSLPSARPGVLADSCTTRKK
ncbi:hypothetical protein BCR43DRAFT_490543 [Syncephalastrum racemosum]|uniref:Ras-GEF domain-containing protein n=1 Tax=Syncephalastrum racemosum TaxID=13706 RepID=A0A1X2HG77_SYNRA|nr:hypothetical protein BCR43DRAFT_490543 [Syncephalastrum racemosum]